MDVWKKISDALKPAEAGAKEPDQKRNAFVNPKAKNAQARATQHYFRTGEQRPLDDFLNDPDLK